jgi:eukaryotic-like serine/threonine-protein kinase
MLPEPDAVSYPWNVHRVADAVSYPWNVHREADNELIPARKNMLQIFKEIGAERSLLILGEPGSGKTTMLLELTKHLLKRASDQEGQPIPIVFNLSSWDEKKSTYDWIIEQLNTIYKVPKKTTQGLIDRNQILLLLDGLDEVKRDCQDACVKAINQFRSEHGLISLVVCCRNQEYAALYTKLELEGAIAIQSLTSNQIENYFTRFGECLSGIKELYKQDAVIQELAETPLMLSIMTLVYRDIPHRKIQRSKDLETQCHHIFDTYIDRMFQRPGRSLSDCSSSEVIGQI